MSYLMYVDNNNLYGSSMCLPLPTGGFKFLKEEERNQFNLMEVQPNSNKGYILQVDLEYPEHLHDLHIDYPLAPETKQISDEMLSPRAANYGQN